LPEFFSSSPDTHFERQTRVVDCTKKFLAIYRPVSEISALILTGNRTHQKEQLFSLPFCRKDFPKTVHISKTKNVKQADSYEVDFLLYG
jgi:hypothetical protein